MLVASYNNEVFNDLLIVMLEPSNPDKQSHERKGNITQITNEETGNIAGYNFFQVSNWVDGLEETGPVTLTEKQVAALNGALEKEGFKGHLEADETPKFVVGYVQECVPHEDSDHLHVTKTEVDNGEVLQIVCGAPNIAQGQKVVVAKPGAVMPDGLVIWPGELRGVESNGMITSERELGLNESADGHRGIMVLDDDAEVGSEFTF